MTAGLDRTRVRYLLFSGRIIFAEGTVILLAHSTKLEKHFTITTITNVSLPQQKKANKPLEPLILLQRAKLLRERERDRVGEGG